MWRKIKWPAVAELVVVVAATALLFRRGWRVGMVRRGCTAWGGEYLLLLFPVAYYIGKRIIGDWLRDL